MTWPAGFCGPHYKAATRTVAFGRQRGINGAKASLQMLTPMKMGKGGMATDHRNKSRSMMTLFWNNRSSPLLFHRIIQCSRVPWDTRLWSSNLGITWRFFPLFCTWHLLRVSYNHTNKHTWQTEVLCAMVEAIHSILHKCHISGSLGHMWPTEIWQWSHAHCCHSHPRLRSETRCLMASA